MRRASAISLLLAICFSTLAAPAFAADDSNLPQCCRRNGEHHCDMATEDAARVDGTSFQSIRMRCPAFPVANFAPVSPYVAFLNDSIAIFASVVSHPSIHIQTEARYRVSFNRSRQKRGPPCLA